MEIISYVLAGALEHSDSIGNTSTIRPGEVQRMSAGTGVRHSEYNPSQSEPTHFLQIWIEPERDGMPPSYEQREFPPDGAGLRLVASRTGREGSVTVHQDVDIYRGLFGAGEEATHEPGPGRHAWVQVLKGAVTLNGVALARGDGAAASEEERLTIRASEPSEILLFDLA
jgi:redox-sensitive bicupin YhaK (pirin superfamily)